MKLKTVEIWGTLTAVAVGCFFVYKRVKAEPVAKALPDPEDSTLPVAIPIVSQGTSKVPLYQEPKVQPEAKITKQELTKTTIDGGITTIEKTQIIQEQNNPDLDEIRVNLWGFSITVPKRAMYSTLLFMSSVYITIKTVPHCIKKYFEKKKELDDYKAKAKIDTEKYEHQKKIDAELYKYKSEIDLAAFKERRSLMGPQETIETDGTVGEEEAEPIPSLSDVDLAKANSGYTSCIRDLITLGENALVYGPPKSGKTTLLVGWGLDSVKPKSSQFFSDYEMERHYCIMYLMETTDDDLRTLYFKDTTIPQNLEIISKNHRPDSVDMLIEDITIRINSVVKKMKDGTLQKRNILFVVDPISALDSSIQGDPIQRYEDCLSKAQALARKIGVELTTISSYHTNGDYDESKPFKPKHAGGNEQFLRSFTCSLFLGKCKDKGKRYLKDIFVRRRAEMDGVYLLERKDNPYPFFQVCGTTTEETALGINNLTEPFEEIPMVPQTEQQMRLDKLLMLIQGGEITKEELAHKCSVSRTQIYSDLNVLIDQGKIPKDFIKRKGLEDQG